jgi:hypothetical protein
MTTRTSPQRLAREAEDALRAAAREVGLRAARPKRSGAADVELTTPAGVVVPFQIKAMALATAERVHALEPTDDRGPPIVVVADQVPAPMRAALADAGLSWLDRRGHLRLLSDEIFIDTDVAAIPRLDGPRDAARTPIAGRSGLAAAAGLLLSPDDPMGVSDIARVAGLNRSSITRAMTNLTDAHFTERHGRGRYRALVPELFWALAEVWPRDHVTIRWATPPEDDTRVDLGFDLDRPGCASAGVRGAVAWGAPLVATADYPALLYFPDEQLVRKLMLLHEGGTGDVAALSVDPIGLISSRRYKSDGLVLPLAHPLFCALDLTQSSRDREALEQWTPPEGFTRVW